MPTKIPLLNLIRFLSCSQWFLIGLLAVLSWSELAWGDHNQPPINYGQTRPSNCISELQNKLDQGQVKLQFDENFGYLKSVLQELNVPLSSQVLVFSKTSLQRHRIGPRTPRAIYFNDDVYIGFCRRGDVMEVSAVDPQLGTVFYTMDQKPSKEPRFVRQGDNCLICHGSSMTHGYPGHMVRSVYTTWDGMPALGLGTVRVNHTSPFEERWGGWYVTGISGKQQHRGNFVLQSRYEKPPADNKKGTNITNLRDKFFVGNYLTPHSDLVALMALEHQTEMHNRITRANFETRLAIYQQKELDRIFKRENEGLSESTKSRIKSVCDPLVEYMLFSGEAKLSEKIRGTSSFAKEFAARGPKDNQGRSLREWDLEKRLFKYPCSYLIYSDAFDQLPQEAKDFIYERLWDILTERDVSAEFDHLLSQDRQAIREILTETLPDLPDYWKG